MSDPRREASERVGAAWEARVLEPSPPAIDAPPWFADDPVAVDEPAAGRRVVSPVPTGDVLWDELAAADPRLASWCAERWLGALRRLRPLPPRYEQTRDRLHELAAQVVSPARERVTGKIGLRYTRGGFGTPFFGADEQLRVHASDLVTVRAGREVAREPLAVDASAVAALADALGFATHVLELLRAQLPPSAQPGRVQLWPEHFDVGLDLRSAAGAELVAGVSPGDEHHAEPYAYVVGERLVVLEYPTLLAAADQRAAALEFLRREIGRW